MHAHESLLQRAPQHDRGAGVPAIGPVSPDDEVVLRPTRWNAAGYCVMCLDWQCQADACASSYATSIRAVCRYCDGSGYDATAEQICSCTSGLVELTNSHWINRSRARPSRLNFAGYCCWCSQRWCDEPTCIETHNQSTWMVCDSCDGLGFNDPTSTPCTCAHGLIEAPR